MNVSIAKLTFLFEYSLPKSRDFSRSLLPLEKVPGWHSVLFLSASSSLMKILYIIIVQDSTDGLSSSFGLLHHVDGTVSFKDGTTEKCFELPPSVGPKVMCPEFEFPSSSGRRISICVKVTLTLLSNQADSSIHCQRFSRMLERGEQSDVMFLVGERSIPAHTAILSASSGVFASLFKHGAVERRAVTIQDAQPRVFMEMLRCAYTGCQPRWCEIGGDEEFILSLVYLAHKYDLPDLMTHCQGRLLIGVTLDNVCGRLKAVGRWCPNFLAELCSVYVQHHANELILSERWLAFAKSSPRIARQVFDLVQMQ